MWFRRGANSGTTVLFLRSVGLRLGGFRAGAHFKFQPANYNHLFFRLALEVLLG
jgi:hypothetical protein